MFSVTTGHGSTTSNRPSPVQTFSGTEQGQKGQDMTHIAEDRAAQARIGEQLEQAGETYTIIGRALRVNPEGFYKARPALHDMGRISRV